MNPSIAFEKSQYEVPNACIQVHCRNIYIIALIDDVATIVRIIDDGFDTPLLITFV